MPKGATRREKCLLLEARFLTPSHGLAVDETPASFSNHGLSLAAWLSPADLAKLCASLSVLLDSPVALQDLAGTVIGGARDLPADARVELRLETELIGYLQAPQAAAAACQAASKLIAQLLRRAPHGLAAAADSADTPVPAETLPRHRDRKSVV